MSSFKINFLIYLKFTSACGVRSSSDLTQITSCPSTALCRWFTVPLWSITTSLCAHVCLWCSGLCFIGLFVPVSDPHCLVTLYRLIAHILLWPFSKLFWLYWWFTLQDKLYDWLVKFHGKSCLTILIGFAFYL